MAIHFLLFRIHLLQLFQPHNKTHPSLTTLALCSYIIHVPLLNPIPGWVQLLNSLP